MPLNWGVSKSLTTSQLGKATGAGASSYLHGGIYPGKEEMQQLRKRKLFFKQLGHWENVSRENPPTHVDTYKRMLSNPAETGRRCEALKATAELKPGIIGRIKSKTRGN